MAKKTTPHRKPAKPAKAPKAGDRSRRAAAPPQLPTVQVRMYRQGLGDCFLLTFDADSPSKRHMLIDCGTLGATTTGVSIEAVADDIEAVIEQSDGAPGQIDFLVATHEHKDHVSGFNSAMQRFSKRVGRIWLAWTENPSDEYAKEIARHEGDLGSALAGIAAAAPHAVADEVYDLLEFAGDPLDPAALGNPGVFAKTIDKAMDFIRTGMGATADFLNPGDVVEPPQIPGFRFYVLGPPRSFERLRDLGGHSGSDLYAMSAGIRAMGLAVFASLNGTKLDERIANSRNDQVPFDQRYQRSLIAERNEHYRSYINASNQWRAIGDDWLRVTSDLALQLDNLTNNTSLALAIERIADGKVLLFPADAQHGNWMSWHDENLKFSKADGASVETTVQNLLGRVVFYKVGHHASHNATAREAGLEWMTREQELTAFIPVDRKVALSRHPKGTWRMPARALYRRLLEKCQGRVARSDIGWANDPAVMGNAQKEVEGEELMNLVAEREWDRYRQAQREAKDDKLVRIEDLFIEYRLR